MEEQKFTDEWGNDFSLVPLAKVEDDWRFALVVYAPNLNEDKTFRRSYYQWFQIYPSVVEGFADVELFVEKTVLIAFSMFKTLYYSGKLTTTGIFDGEVAYYHWNALTKQEERL